MLYLISQDSLSVLYLISLKIPIMFLMVGHCCKDFHRLLEAHEIRQSLKRYLLKEYGTDQNITVEFHGGYLLPPT